MINLINLEIFNFLSIEYLKLDFPKPGNYLISGYNEIGCDSNGSGKSSILNAIIYGLFGRTVKGLSGAQVTRWGSDKSAKVCINFQSIDGQNNYEITRTPDQTDFLINGQVISGHKKDIQQSINDSFHTNFDLVLSSIFFTKGGADFLTDSGDAAKKRLFKSLLRLEKIDKMYDKAKSLYDSLKVQAQGLEYEIRTKTDKVESFKKEIWSYDDRSKDWEAKKIQEIEVLTKKIEEAVPTIDSSLENLFKEKEHALEIIWTNLKEETESLPSVQEELSKVYRDIGQQKAIKESLEEELQISQTLQGSTCTYCGARLTKKGMEIHVQEMTQKIEEATNKLSSLYARMKELETRISSVDKLNQNYIKLSKEKEHLYIMVLDQRQKIENFKQTQKVIQNQLGDIQNRENPYNQIVITKTQELSHIEESLKNNQNDFIATTKTIDIYGYVKWVLSREGVVSAIIEKTFNRLESLINHYLSSICTEGFFIQIRPQRELKSGALKDEIDISITQNGRKIPYASLSGGQEQRVTVASLLALYKLSKEIGMNRFNFLLLDEVLDLSLADKGQQDIIRLLEGMEKEIRNIFVISHKDSLATEFPFQIDVRREKDGITKLVGVYQ